MLWACAAGFVLGALAQLCDDWSPWLGDLTSYAGVWVVVAAWVGAWSPSARRASAASAALFLASLASYYALFHVRDGGAPVAVAVLWVAVSLSLAPALAVAGHTASRRSGASALRARALLLGVLLGEAAWVALVVNSPTRWGLVGFDAVAASVLLRRWWSRGRGWVLVGVSVLLAGGFQVALATFYGVMRSR